MFGATRPTFGAAAPGATPTFGFGAAATSTAAPAPAFGAPAQQQQQQQQQAAAFGGAAGGLFGAAQQPAAAGASTAFGAPGASTGFGSASAFGKPATTSAFGFGTTTPTAGAVAAPAGGGLFGAAAGGTPFGATPATAQPTFGGFGQAAASAHTTGTTVKFQAPTGSDTMMKSGVTTNISTRHQCITCMKEYETKSLEELRCEDYLAGRKGATGTATSGGGLFGAAPNQTAAPGTSGGSFFGAQTPAVSSQSSLFGQQQQQKPLFGGTSTAFGASTTSTPFGGGASTFGATSTQPATGGLFGSTSTTGFGATTSTTGFGGFGATTSTSGGGLFGASQSKPLGGAFGTTTTTQSGGLFGSTATPAFGAQPAQPAFGSTTSGFGTQQTGGGLFGSTQAKPAGFGVPGSTATTGFGGFGSTTTSQAPAFGQNAAKPAFGGFGTTATPTGGFGGFGQTSAAPAGGGLFGQTQQQKPPSLSFGTSFGQTSTPGFGGFSTNTSTATSGGLFGSNTAQQQKPGGLFGSGATGGFGTTNTAFGGTNAAFGAGTSSFGSGLGNTTGSSMFGSGTTGFGGFNQPQSNATAGFNLGGGALGQAAAPGAATAASNPIQQQLLQLSNSPYGENPLFKTLLQDSGKREEILKPINPSAQKALETGVNQYKVSPHRSIIKAKAKPLSVSGSASANRSTIFDGLEDNDDLDKSTTDLFVPRSSVKKLVLKPKSPMVNASRVTPNAENSARSALSTPVASGGKKGLIIPPPPNLELSADESSLLNSTTNKVTDSSGSGRKKSPVLCSGTSGGLDQPEESFAIPRSKIPNPDSTTVGEDSFAVQNPQEEVSEEEDNVENNNPAGIKLRRPGYYTIPALSEIGCMVDEAAGTCHVENFTVGRKGYGNIFFPGVTDVMNLNLDEIVFFRHKEVTVYPDEAKKPPLGSGLNKKAQVTLDRVWPVDKTTRSSIKSTDKLIEMNYEEKLQKACLKLGARFVEYRPETGSWVFKVDHFSKYGLDDSDEEDAEIPLEVQKKITAPPQIKDSAVSTAMPSAPAQFPKRPTGSGYLMQTGYDQYITLPTSETSEKQHLSVLPRFSDQIRPFSGSLFGLDDSDENDAEMRPEKEMISAPTQLFKDPSVIAPPSSIGASTFFKRSTLPGYSLQAGYDQYVTLPASGTSEKQQCVVPRHADHLRPLSESLFADKLSYLADTGLVMGRRFRPGWAGWRIAHCGSAFYHLAGNSKISLVHLERIGTSSFGPVTEEQLGALESWLRVSLKNAELTFDGSDADIAEENFPKFSVCESVDTLHAFADEATQQLTRNESVDAAFGRGLKEYKRVWDLCLALWGHLKEQEIYQYGPDSHEVAMLRRQAVSDWLEDAVSSSSRADLDAAVLKGNAIDEILALLSGNQLSKACVKAHSAGDHYAALLMGSAGGLNSMNGQMLLQQLDRWQELRADKYVAVNRLRMYALLAGVPVWPGSNGVQINVCDGLDWKRAFALHFWFLTSPVASVADAFVAYEGAFQEDGEHEAYAQFPSPEYDPTEYDARDIKYHLLKLYTQRSHSLEVLLTPKTHTSDPLDHRLSWFLGEALKAIGYSHMKAEKVDQLHSSFAAQLESMGFWHWAVFVLLHLDDLEERRTKITALLGRHIQLSDDDSTDKETFIMDELHVPVTWIAEAKGIKAYI